MQAKKPSANRENIALQKRKTDLSRSMSPPAGRILFLQRTIGNQAVQKLINIQRQEQQSIESSPKRCGPDITDWLINQMNTNMNHPVIRTGREVKWPRYIPFFNIGWTAGFMNDFKNLVKPGGPWDFKRNQTWWRAGQGRSCPTRNCDRTVTMCGICFNYDVPGNIHYGWVGGMAGLRPWVLRAAPAVVSEIGLDIDDPKDTAAINIGIDMADKGVYLCDELGRQRNNLNLDGTEGCKIC